MTPPGELEVVPGAEHGDRRAFLDRIRSRQGPPPRIGPHPPPPPPIDVPEVGYRALDGVTGHDDLVDAFVAAARAVAATVHVGGIDEALAVACATHDVRHTVVSREPAARATRGALAALGVEVADHEPAASALADLGVTSCVAAIAATGSVVVDSAAAGGRGASLLPAVHLCIVPRSLVVATPSDVFRRGQRPLPSNRVVITGPSRTGDIEQIITLGAHGPTAVHLVLVDDPAPALGP